MSQSDTVLIAIGGGELAESEEVVKELVELIRKKSDPSVTVMTVATDQPEQAAAKYSSFFRGKGIKHVEIVDVSERDDAFDEKALDKIRRADALFFTGGDQLNVTSLIGGSPLHDTIFEKYSEGFIIAGTSAGAMMMSNSMIISGRSDSAPAVGGVEIAPGMNLLSSTIIDTHFSERGRHGRLITAIAHYPQDLGIGIDERTAIVARNGQFKVVGEGVVTIIDGSEMHHSNLPYRKQDQTLGIFGACFHVLPAGYKYDLKKREPISPSLKKLAIAAEDV
jgi:cyanophycinase